MATRPPLPDLLGGMSTRKSENKSADTIVRRIVIGGLSPVQAFDGKRTVTHWNFGDRLAREFPKVPVLANPIFLRGSIYTSEGINTGIDFPLEPEEDHGHQVALAVVRQWSCVLLSLGGQATVQPDALSPGNNL